MNHEMFSPALSVSGVYLMVGVLIAIRERQRTLLLLGWLDVIETVCDVRAAWRAYGDQRTWAESFDVWIHEKGHLLTLEQTWLARGVAQFLEDSEEVRRG